MADNIIISSQSIDDKALTVTSFATGYPKTNLQDRRLSTSWRSTSNANQNVDIDFGSAKTCDHILLYHNLPAGTTIRPYYASQSNYSDELPAAPSSSIGSGNTPILYQAFSASYIARYWRFKITNIPVSTVAEVMLIFMGQRREITIRYNKGALITDDYSGVQIQESYSGRRFSKQFHEARKIINVNWELLDATNRARLQNVISESAGSALPFFLLTLDDTWNYVRLMNANLNDIEAEAFLYNIGPLIFEEEF